MSLSSSTRPCSMSVRTSWRLPATTISPFRFFFRFETSLTTSPLRTVELFQSGSSRVADTTYFGMLFNLSANAPVRDGHRAANHSYVRRPISMASAPRASSSASLASAGRSLIRPTQPPRGKPSSPAGSWMTPSSDTLSLTTIFPMSMSSLGLPRAARVDDPRGSVHLIRFLPPYFGPCHDLHLCAQEGGRHGARIGLGDQGPAGRLWHGGVTPVARGPSVV